MKITKTPDDAMVIALLCFLLAQGMQQPMAFVVAIVGVVWCVKSVIRAE